MKINSLDKLFLFFLHFLNTVKIQIYMEIFFLEREREIRNMNENKSERVVMVVVLLLNYLFHYTDYEI